MKSKRRLLLLMVCLALIQVAVASAMIVRREIALRYGRQFRFRITSYGPYTSAQGRYVPLVIESDNLPYVPGAETRPGRTVYALIEKDGEGFAQLRGRVGTRPAGDSWIQASVRFVDRSNIRLRLPFDRYYVEAELAPRVEAACRRQNTAQARSAQITVRVRGGFAVLEDLYIDGRPVSEFLQTPR